MASLSGKTDQQISDLLDEYEIRHGPVVDSTRSLYEKKLKEAMAKGKKAKPSSDKTYYREEEEEVTYVYRTPVRSEGGAGDSGNYLRSRPDWSHREFEHEPTYSSYSRPQRDYREREYVDEPHMYDTPSTYRSTYSKSPKSSAPDTSSTQKSSRLIPLWVQFVFFLAVAVFLYFVFSTMETNKSLQGIE